MRDSNTRALQLANQELREQLDASNLLLRQLASGAPEVRGPILDFLAGNKQPREIIRALRIDNSLGLRPKLSERRQGTWHSLNLTPCLLVVEQNSYTHLLARQDRLSIARLTNPGLGESLQGGM